MNYLRPFKTCFCEKHVLDLSRHLPRLCFERRSKFSSRNTVPLPGRMRNSPRSLKASRRFSLIIVAGQCFLLTLTGLWLRYKKKAGKRPGPSFPLRAELLVVHATHAAHAATRHCQHPSTSKQCCEA